MSRRRWAAICLTLLLLGLSGCTVAFNGSPAARHQVKQDDKTCRAYGLRSHTREYDACREELEKKASHQH